MSDALDKYALAGLVSVASGMQLTRFAMHVGKCRHKVGLQYPETVGPDEFNRCFRAQQNSLEFYPTTLGVFWVASVFGHPVPASLLFAGYMYGRHKYFYGYCESVEGRLPGFYLSIRFLKALAFLAVAAAGNRLVRHSFDVDLGKIIWDHLPAIKSD